MTALDKIPIDKTMMINMDNYQPIMSDSALATKSRVLALSGFLIILGVTFVLYLGTEEELFLLVIPFMLLVTYGIYLVFYYLI